MIEETEQTAKKLIAKEKIKADAEASAAKVLAEAKKNAETMVKKAENSAAEITNKAKLQAENESTKLMTDARKNADSYSLTQKRPWRKQYLKPPGSSDRFRPGRS